MKSRIHVSLHTPILEKLDRICALRDFGDRTAAIEQLIREEWERREASKHAAVLAYIERDAALRGNESGASEPLSTRETPDSYSTPTPANPGSNPLSAGVSAAADDVRKSKGSAGPPMGKPHKRSRGS